MKNDKILSYQNKLEKRLFFKYLLLANKPGVYAFINEKDKKVFVQCSKAIITSIGDVTYQVANKLHYSKDMKRDRKKLQIKILEYCDNKYKEIDKLKWMQHYISQGYTLYNQEKMPQYKIRQYVTNDFLIEIQLVTKGKRVYKVKTVASHDEANLFIASNDIFSMMKLII